MPLSPPNGALVGYTLVRHLGLMLDELSSQGLELWLDERSSWHWRWRGSTLSWDAPVSARSPSTVPRQIASPAAWSDSYGHERGPVSASRALLPTC